MCKKNVALWCKMFIVVEMKKESKQVRIDDHNFERIKKWRKTWPAQMSVTRLANILISKGLMHETHQGQK